MELVDEIVELLSTEKGSLTDALLKTKILLHSLGQLELITWVNSELNGYPDQQEIPDYRKVPSQILANLTSISFQANSHPLPIGHLSKEKREGLEVSEMRQALSVLESFSENTDGSLASTIPLEWNGMLSKSLASGVSIQQAWTQIEVTSVLQILTEVRSRLLDFILNLRGQLQKEDRSTEPSTIDAKSLFNNAILGDNATIIIGDKNNTEVMNMYLKGNVDALVHELKKYDVPDEDISDLKKAISSDESDLDTSARKFGSNIKVWIKGMLHKAVETSWQIEVGMASAILTDALKHYYGW